MNGSLVRCASSTFIASTPCPDILPAPRSPAAPARCSSSIRRCSEFMRRSSIGSIPNCPASSSIVISTAKHDCVTPKPRNAPAGTLLVYIAKQSDLAFGTSYGPLACVVARVNTFSPRLAYAPVSPYNSAFAAVKRPSFFAPIFTVIVVACRLGCVINDSCRVYRHLHRAARCLRQQRHVNLPHDVFFAAKAAADQRADDAHLRLPARPGTLPLARDPDTQSASRRRFRNAHRPSSARSSIPAPGRRARSNAV